jgi:2-hydroxychromene-2-carboxylate isomerase
VDAAAGCFGTPNYCVNGEIFWGQDRLEYAEDRIKELVTKGFKPL